MNSQEFCQKIKNIESQSIMYKFDNFEYVNIEYFNSKCEELFLEILSELGYIEGVEYFKKIKHSIRR